MDGLVWLVMTSLWLAARYSLNPMDGGVRRVATFEQGRLFVLLITALLLLTVMTLPVLVFMRTVNRDLVTDAGELAILDNLAYCQFGSYGLLWLVGPTREVFIAWNRSRAS
jgi:hypothetical protein